MTVFTTVFTILLDLLIACVIYRWTGAPLWAAIIVFWVLRILDRVQLLVTRSNGPKP